MGRRISIMMDEDLVKKLRLIQAKSIEANKSMSFSRVVNERLRKGLKK